MTPEQVAIINTVSIQTLKETRMKGIEEGIDEGETNIILHLLKHETPLEISKKLEIPLERIEKIQNTR